MGVLLEAGILVRNVQKMVIFRVQIGGWAFIRAWAFIRDFKVICNCILIQCAPIWTLSADGMNY